MLVHFPIALLFAAVGLDLYACLGRDERAAWAGRLLLVLGTVGAMFAFVSGSFAEIWAARPPAYVPQEPLKRHEGLATLTSWLFIGLVAFRSFLSPTAARPLFRAYLAVALVGLAFLALTGWHGGQLVYRYGSGVEGRTHVPTAQDLAVLSQRNSRDELDYSEIMHHIFGWLVLGLAIWLAYQQFNLPYVEGIRAIGPVLLVAGGVFLMIFSDFDAWPLSDIKPITDREVLAHKLIATMMILIGMGASLVRKGAGSQAGNLQNRLVAVLALAGGGILFTHVHTTAPYSDTAIGVYLHHLSLGILALLCGGVKVLQAWLPGRRQLWDQIWILLLFCISFMLLTYNEGIPWYLEY